MGAAIEQLGMQAAEGTLGGIMGLALGSIENKRQIKQQKKLQALQIQGQKDMTDYNWQKQLDMWKATNYGAQMEQLKNAGLNPGLIYGMGGTGGATTGNASGNVQGATAMKSEGAAMGMTAMNLGLMGAQKELIEAQAEKTRAEIPNLAKTGENIQANTELTKIETRLKNIDSQIKGRTIEDAIDIITAEAGKATYDVLITQRQNQIEQATVEATMQKIQSEAIGAALNNILTKEHINVQKATIDKIAAEIAQGWTHLAQEQRALEIKDWEAVMKANNVPIGQVLGKVFNNALEEIRNATKPKYRGYSIPKAK